MTAASFQTEGGRLRGGGERGGGGKQPASADYGSCPAATITIMVDIEAANKAIVIVIRSRTF